MLHQNHQENRWHLPEQLHIYRSRSLNKFFSIHSSQRNDLFHIADIEVFSSLLYFPVAGEANSSFTPSFSKRITRPGNFFIQVKLCVAIITVVPESRIL